MKKFIKVALYYVLRNKRLTFFTILFNILGIIFQLFSITLVIPLLNILFQKVSTVYHLQAWKISVNVLLNNFFYVPFSQLKQLYGNEVTIVVVCILFIVMIFLKTTCQYLASHFMTPFRNNIVRDLRNDIFSKILKLHLGYFTESRKGDIMSRMAGDISEVEQSIMSTVEVLFRDTFNIILYLGIMIGMSPELTFKVLLLISLGGIVIGLAGKSLRKDSMKVQTRLGELMSTIEETIGGLRIIKAFNGEDKTRERFFSVNNELTRSLNKAVRRRFLASPLSEFLATIIVAAIMFFGGKLILAGQSALQSADFIVYVFIFVTIINPAKNLSTAFYSLQKGMASVERINIILTAEEKIVDKEGAIELVEFKKNITFEQVCFSYETEQVLKDINISIEKGTTVALVGQSGSGKSTLVDLIPRFYDVKEGKIRIDGIPIQDVTLHSLRHLMGNVNQEAILFNDTFFQNIAFGVESCSMEDVVQAAKVANAHDFIMATENGYLTTIGDRGGKLSGGQRQRISIARAVLKNPPILILDEATSALDTESEYLVQEALVNLMKNRTSIVIAHRLSTIRNADVIYVLHEGEIVEHGNHEELISKAGVYKKLYDLQIF